MAASATQWSSDAPALTTALLVQPACPCRASNTVAAELTMNWKKSFGVCGVGVRNSSRASSSQTFPSLSLASASNGPGFLSETSPTYRFSLS